MDWIQYVVTFDKPAVPEIDGSDSITVEVVARTISSGVGKALDIAKGHAGSRQIVGVAFAQILRGAERDESSAAFSVDRCVDFVAAVVSRGNPHNSFYVPRVAS